MKNTLINRAIIKKIAGALGNLNEHVVYVGGAIVSFYVDDPAAEDVRPTKDIDITLKIASVMELENLRLALVDKGFKQSADLDVICRFKYEDILVDVMSTKAISWIPANRWFEKGFDNMQEAIIDDVTIHIMPLSFFLASKFSAFENRGGDPRFSHDFEDIIYILDNRTDWDTVLLTEQDNEVKEFLIDRIGAIKSSVMLQEAVIGNLFYETSEERFAQIMHKIVHFSAQ
jgi:predicted nucleotidyltransferase